MKLTKILIFMLMAVLTVSLISCDVEGVLDGVLGEGTDGDGTILDGGSNLDGNGNLDGDDNSGLEGEHECDYKLEYEIPATCENGGTKGYKCSCGKTKTEPTDALSHTEEKIEATEPSGSTPGTTEGVRCSVCGIVLVQPEYVFENDYSVPEKYDGDYAYNSLLKLSKAEKLTKLYNLIDKEADAFHNGNKNATADNNYIVASINYASLGLSDEEAMAVWSAYHIDRPLYYWISNNIYYSSTEISLVVDTEYASASVRAALNAKIYAGVEDFVEEAYSQSKYNTALAFHDLIILAIDYAYEQDGRTPEDDPWAHNVIGVFDKGAGVCEAYAKTFQLLLNYCEIENILVTGWANELHAWNLIQLDDGKWYWCDLTWDDKPGFMWGITYNYFCVNDTENVGWSDGPFTTAPSTFVSDHTPNPKTDTGMSFSYDLPARSDTKFDGDCIMIKDTFTIGSLTYAVAGYNSVQLVSVTAPGVLNIPASVSYMGETLAVISVGKMEDGKFTVGSIASYKNGEYTEQYAVTEIIIPESVIFIWDNAFNMDALTKITVHADNTVFTSLNDVLYTKDLTTLIKYPNAKAGREFTLPKETVRIAYGALSTLYYNTGALLLEKVYLSADAVVAGVRNYGYGYENAKYFEENPWNSIREKLSGAKTIYNKDGSVLQAS